MRRVYRWEVGGWERLGNGEGEVVPDFTLG